MTQKKPLCIYHGGCADGFTAAWAVWRHFGDEFDYHAGVYQTPPPDVAGRDVVFVDFSYKREVLLEMGKTATGILVLDHHKSAAEDLGPGERFFAMHPRTATWEQWNTNVGQDRLENADLNGVYIYTVFDIERSGAGIAWDFFHPARLRPNLVNYVEDRDLWKFELPHSREVNANIFSHAYSFETWDMLEEHLRTPNDVAAFAKQGAAIERKHHKDIAELVSELRRPMIIGGHRIPVANLPKTLTSDAGSLMCSEWFGDMEQDGVTAKMPPFAACYWDAPQGRVFSLRSRGDFDVSEIAKQYGGGGHKNAAGFTLPHGVAP